MRSQIMIENQIKLWLFPILLIICGTVSGNELEIVNEWGVFEWDHYTPGYDPAKAIPVSLEITPRRVFIAIPRLYSGLPASLAVIPRNSHARSYITPKLQAWPNIEWHQENGNCNSTIVNVFRMRLDRCDRLWVLDSGVRDTFESFTVQCPPKILVFDLNSDTLLRLILVNQDLLRRNSLLTNIVLDDHQSGRGRCDRGLVVYLSDVASPAIIVYDPRRDRMWRFSHPKMYPDPEHGLYTVEGESFTLMDGILGMALTPPSFHPKRLFFQPFASNKIFSIDTANLERGPNLGDDSDLPVRLEGTKSSQAAGMIFDPQDGSLFFSPVSEEIVVAWIPGTTTPRTVAQNRELLQFVLDMRIPPSDPTNVWLISTKLQKFVKQDVNPRIPHIRIIRVNTNYYNNTIYK